MSGDRVDEQELTKMAFEINGTKQNPSMKSEVDILLMSEFEFEFEFVKQSVAGKVRGDEERSDLQCFQELTKVFDNDQCGATRSEVDTLLSAEFATVTKCIPGKLRGDEERSDLQCFQEVIKVFNNDQCGATRSEVDTLLSAEFATVTKCIPGKPITRNYWSSKFFKISVGDAKKVIQRVFKFAKAVFGSKPAQDLKDFINLVGYFSKGVQCIIFLVEAANFLCPYLFEGVNFMRQMTNFVSKVVRAYSYAMKEFLTETFQLVANNYIFRGLQSEAEEEHQD